MSVELRPRSSPGWTPSMHLAAAALLLVANGRNSVFVAAWLAPIALRRFVRGQLAWLGIPVAFAALSAAFAFQFRGMIPVPGDDRLQELVDARHLDDVPGQVGQLVRAIG